jgi:hypothetical protein
MAKKTHRRGLPASEGSAGKDFVRAVQATYNSVINERESDFTISSLPERDRAAAMSVATGFILLRQLLNREMQRTDVADLDVYKALNAQEILDALIGDLGGPIRRYIAHLGLPQKLPSNRTAALRRSMVVGFVYALEHASERDGAKLKPEQAKRMVSESSGNFYTVDMIKGWIRHKTAPFAQAVAQELLRDAERAVAQLEKPAPLTLGVYAAGRNMLRASTPLLFSTRA